MSNGTIKKINNKVIKFCLFQVLNRGKCIYQWNYKAMIISIYKAVIRSMQNKEEQKTALIYIETWIENEEI